MSMLVRWRQFRFWRCCKIAWIYIGFAFLQMQHPETWWSRWMETHENKMRRSHFVSRVHQHITNCFKHTELIQFCISCFSRWLIDWSGLIESRRVDLKIAMEYFLVEILYYKVRNDVKVYPNLHFTIVLHVIKKKWVMRY